MRLTKEQVKRMLPGQSMSIQCDNAAELDSVYQTALQARKESGVGYGISRSAKTMTVEISLAKKGDAQ